MIYQLWIRRDGKWEMFGFWENKKDAESARFDSDGEIDDWRVIGVID